MIKKFIVGISDDRWLDYHIEHNSQKVTFWGIYKTGVNFYKVFKEHLNNIGGVENLQNNPLIFFFKTKVEEKFEDRNNRGNLTGCAIYGWGEITNVCEKGKPNLNPNQTLPTINSVSDLWNAYGTMNGCDDIKELPILLGNKANDINYLSNVIIENCHYFESPLDIKWWNINYRGIVRGKVCKADDSMKPPKNPPQLVTADIDACNWLYWALKSKDPTIPF